MKYSAIYKSTITGEMITSRHWFDTKKECEKALHSAGIQEYKIREVNKKFIY